MKEEVTAAVTTANYNMSNFAHRKPHHELVEIWTFARVGRDIRRADRKRRGCQERDLIKGGAKRDGNEGRHTLGRWKWVAGIQPLYTGVCCRLKANDCWRMKGDTKHIFNVSLDEILEKQRLFWLELLPLWSQF